VDGQIIPDQPLTLFTNGQFNYVPLMNGNTADETNFGLAITEYFSTRTILFAHRHPRSNI
jgi:hypothetical protein